jgi:hypothetical protein
MRSSSSALGETGEVENIFPSALGTTGALENIVPSAFNKLLEEAIRRHCSRKLSWRHQICSITLCMDTHRFTIYTHIKSERERETERERDRGRERERERCCLLVFCPPHVFILQGTILLEEGLRV